MKTKLLCLFLLCVSFSIQGQVYNFPVKPGTPEWGKLNSYQEMIEVCRVPEKLLSTMNTGDLLETCLNHPFKGNIYLYSSIGEGFQAMVNTFNVFEEIVKRDDIGSYLLAAAKSVSATNSKTLTASNEYKINLNKRLLKLLLTYPTIRTKLTEDVKSTISTILGNDNFYTSTSPAAIYTPQGCLVSDTEYYPEELSDAEKAIIDQNAQAQFPQATLLSSSTTTYNCHGYAWNVSEGGSAVWMGTKTNPTSIYWTDGSYSSTSSTTTSGLKVSYASDNHSAVTTGVAGEVISKWGYGPRMRHAYNYCPYNSTSVNYYKKNILYITGTYAQNSTWHTLNTVNFVTAGVPVTLNVDYPNASQITWQLTSGGSDVTWGVQGQNGRIVGITIYSSPQASLKGTAYGPCKTVSNEFFFHRANSYTVRYDQERGLIDIIFNREVTAKKTYQLTLVTVSGNIVRQLSFSDDITIDISGLKENIYYLNITDGTSEGTYRQAITRK
jgi:hypothetical protein